jgi:hypothetical protein
VGLMFGHVMGMIFHLVTYLPWAISQTPLR